MLWIKTLISALERSLGNGLEMWLLEYLRPMPAMSVLVTIGDLARSRIELISESALLRHQLGILRRQVRRPQLTKADRVGHLFLASRLAHWREALLIVKPETLLRWHRELQRFASVAGIDLLPMGKHMRSQNLTGAQIRAMYFCDGAGELSPACHAFFAQAIADCIYRTGECTP